MDTARRPAAPYRKAPFFLQVRSLDSRAKELWTLSLDSELLMLLRPDNAAVLTLHREEAARYMRFEYDLLRGRTVSLVIIEGLRRYTFCCTREQMRKLLAWLPHLSEGELTKQIRYSGTAVALFGLFHVLLPQSLFWIWGVVLIGAGVLGAARPRRGMYVVNAALLFLAGLWDLFTGPPGHLLPWNVPPEDRLVPIVVGVVTVLWAIQQILMFGPNQQLRVARGIRDQRASFLPMHSRLVRRVGWCNLAAAIGFGVYAVVMAVTAPARAKAVVGTGLLGGLSPASFDGIVFAVLALFAAGCALRFMPRNPPVYFEAKASAQALITALVFSAWGLVFSVRTGVPFPGIFSAHFSLFAQAPVWISLLACVLLFNRWFIRAVDRELEEQRG